MVNLRGKGFLLVVMFVQLMVYITVLFDIRFARQVVGFIYFTFFSGFVILKLLGLNELNWTETVLFSLGLSITFLMIAGFLINELGFLFGVSQPLSLTPLLAFLNGIILAFTFLVYLRDKSVKVLSSDSLRVSRSILVFMVLPVLSIVGAMCVNVYGNNLLLLSMMIVISLLFIFCVLFKKPFATNLYPFAVLMIAIALLYHSSFISNYLVAFGSDLAGEYFVFKTTEVNAHWSSIEPYIRGGWPSFGRLNAMLSITILPTVYSSLLNIDSIWIFKMIFPLIFAFVPLGLYQVWQTYVSKKYAFMAAFLFMADMTFYTEMLGLNRQMIAELFFVLLLLVITHKKMKPSNKILCFMIFSFGLVTSHYGLAELLLFLFSVALLSLIVLKRPSRNLTISMVVFFFVIMFSWYIYTSYSAVFESILEFGDYVYQQLDEFFNPASRGETVLRGLGLEAPPTIWNAISRMFAYVTEALIVVGFLGLITKRVRVNFGKEYFVLTVTAMVFLGMLIVVPGLANTMNITRFYHVLLFFLAPLCMLGAETVMNLFSKRNIEVKVSVLLLIVLVPYFLFQTGFVYEVTKNDSWSVPLSGYRMNALRLMVGIGYSDTFSVLGAQWVLSNVAVRQTQIYSDWSAAMELRAYGLVYPGYVASLSNTTKVIANGVVYLNSLNIIEDTLISSRLMWNTSEISFLNDMNIVYSNGGSKIYKNTP